MITAVIGVALVLMLFVILRSAIVKPKLSREYRQYVTMKNPQWRELRKNTFAFTRGRDVLLPFLKAEELDHLRYRRNGQNIFGYERPMIDVVPLSRFTHRIVTVLRRAGLRRPVNGVLRASFLFWFRIAPVTVFCVIPVTVFCIILYSLAITSGLVRPSTFVTNSLHAIHNVGIANLEATAASFVKWLRWISYVQ